MAGSLNKVMVIGNLGADPEMRYAPSGSAVTTFRVAANRRWTGQDGQPREETEWFRIVTWDKLAEICGQSLSKGRLVYVEGRLKTRDWVDKEGLKRYTTEVVAETVRFLDSSRSRSGEAGSELDDDPGGSTEPSRGQRRPAGTRAGAPDGEPDGDTELDDIPF